MAKLILHRKNRGNYHNVQLTTAIISFRAGSLSSSSPLPALRLKTPVNREQTGIEEKRMDGVAGRVQGRGHVNTNNNLVAESYSNGAGWSTSQRPR